MAELPAPELTDDAPAPASGGRRKKGGGGILPVLLTAVLVGPMCIGGYMMYTKTAAARDKALAEYESDPSKLETVTWPIETQTINLADGDRYARCGLALAFQLDKVDAAHFREVAATRVENAKALPEAPPSDEKPVKKQPGKEVKTLLYLLATNADQINDAVIQEVGSRKYDELLSNEDKLQLKKSLLARLGKLLTGSDLTLHDIYLSEFVMQ